MANVGSQSGATKKQVIITDCGQLWKGSLLTLDSAWWYLHYLVTTVVSIGL
jgi:hypothetical protein